MIATIERLYFLLAPPPCQVLQKKSNVMSCLSISIFPYQLISKVQYSSTWVIYHTILLRIWNDKANHFLASLSLQNIYFLLGLFANINLNILNPSLRFWKLVFTLKLLFQLSGGEKTSTSIFVLVYNYVIR